MIAARRWVPLAGLALSLALSLACTRTDQPTPTRERDTSASVQIPAQPSPVEVEAATQDRLLGPAPAESAQTRADRREAVLALLTDGTTAKHLGIDVVDFGDEFEPGAGERFPHLGLHPYVGHGESTLSGPGRLERGTIRRIVFRQQDQLRGCYDEARSADALLSRTLQLRFEIRADGTVGDPTLARPPAQHDALDRCVLAAVATWTFPKPEGGPVSVDYPLHLRPR